MRSARTSREAGDHTPAATPAASRRRRWWRALAGTAAGFALAVALAWFAIDSNASRARLRSEVARALEARVPGARLEGGARIDGRLRLVAGPITVRLRPSGTPVMRVERAVVRPKLTSLLTGHLEVAAVSLAGVRVDAGYRGEAIREALRAQSPQGAARAPGRRAPLPEVDVRDMTVHVALALGDDPTALDVGPLGARVRLQREGAAMVADAVLDLPGGARGSARVRLGQGCALVARVDHLGPSALPSLVRERLPFALERGELSIGLEVPAAARASRGEAWLEVAAAGLVLRSISPVNAETESDSRRLAAPGEEPGGSTASPRRLLRHEEREVSRHETARGRESLPTGPRGGPPAQETPNGDTPSGEVGPVDARLAGELRWDADAPRLALAPARLDIGRSGRVGVDVSLTIEARPEPLFALEVHARDVDWTAALQALPAPLRPPGEAPPVQGAIAGWLSVSGPAGRPAAWRIDGDVDPSRLEPAAGSRALSLPFTWEAPLPDGRTRRVVIGPANPSFVPLGALPPYVVRAVLSSEDAAFYAHHGFDLHEIQDAVANAASHPRLRGASTITQQLAKNLYLSPERTFTRKAREALATIALEASVGKRRLLEIYLNLAEWGPGVYGIGEAARHWFGKDARALSPKEGAFLASVIPNPIRYEMYRRRGALTELWEERVRALLLKLRAADALTPEQLREAWDEPLEFVHG